MQPKMFRPWLGLATLAVALPLFNGCSKNGPSAEFHSSRTAGAYRPSADQSAPSTTQTTDGRILLTDRAHCRDDEFPRVESDRSRRDRATVFNPWTDTDNDARSTFGLDVDTAAFAVAREYLLRDHLPPADAVRTEEFVNYFDYQDPAKPDQTFTVNAELAPTPFARNAYLLRIGLRARPLTAQQRKPARLTFVVDVSGSMAPAKRLPLVREALHDLVNRLNPDDQVAIVTFSDRAEVFLNMTAMDQKQTIHRVIDNLLVAGTTAIDDGLKLGYQLAWQNFDKDGINRVIFCSDGEANVGDTSPAGILADIERYKNQGIYLSAVGFGLKDYNDQLLETLADKGDGAYDHVDDIHEADRVFGEKLTSLLEVVAKDAKIQVEFNPERVAEYRLLGYENRAVADRDFRNDRVDAGEVGAGHAVTALYEITLRETARDGDRLVRRGARREVIDRQIDALVGDAPALARDERHRDPDFDGDRRTDPPARTDHPRLPDDDPRRDDARQAPAANHLATIRLRWKYPDNRRGETVAAGREEILETSHTLTDLALEQTLSRTSSDFRLSMAAAQLSELLRGSPYAARQDIDAVLALAHSVALDRPDDEKIRDLIDMTLRLKQLGGEPRLSRR